MNIKNGFKKFKNLFIRFWRSDNNKVSLVRDVFIAFLIVISVLLILWGYTGQWFGAPMVAIESNSMMHENEPFGRIGTIDAGDMVLLVKIDKQSDIEPFIVNNKNNIQYGKTGDVIVYKPDGNENSDQIIHRAMCWLEVRENGSIKTYTIDEYGIINHSASDPLFVPEVGIRTRPTPGKPDGGPITVDWSHSGFITKGDNPNTNPTCDQVGGISDEPVKVEWISGKARGELPWIGTINLFFNDIFSSKNTVANVPQDSIICLIILIAFFVSIPITLDVISWYKSKNEKKISKTSQNTDFEWEYPKIPHHENKKNFFRRFKRK